MSSEKVEVGSLTKSEFIRAACKKSEEGLSYKLMEDAHAALLETIMDALKDGVSVPLQGIGRLVPIIRPGGEARNPATGEQVTYGDRLGLKFQVNANFKLALRSVDIKSLGTGGDSKQLDEKGQKEKAGTSRRAADKEAPSRPSRRR